jgi:hypothetical protein
MNRVSILIGKYYGNITYWSVFKNRDLAECQKRKFELDDALFRREGWTYFIQDEIVYKNVS